ncbi:membrane-associated guanylate kinase, WW and PDZ domain-containing protein 3 isoform X1 [Cyprinodon tularosa]|uniref:membrane-associated guanylate kinase, WW and PDZ domain-containing protein 3 isoform X1 n=1 Tax=Cyprinodon tularosa TaxID=77115 RepID=UPI0018E28E0D|nr:membrane-associated guanylate kinase, WW and PDZ domain-containing protein 3 isoform X1 [Cyprinodon tularosa]
MYIDAFKRILFERLNCLKRMCVCQRHGSSFAMSKTAVKKLHWRSNVQDTFVLLLGESGEVGVAIGGGADYGEFPFVTSAPGGGITVGDVILEIGGTPVLGMTLGDVRGVLNSCPHPVRIKTVSPGSTLCKDLRLYLSKCFTPGSVDSQLQQVIRENLYLRAVPCTTRHPRDGEISGVDYNFVSVEEFFSLEESGALLESGKFKGNYYGTPRPVHIGPESPPITYQEHRNLLRNFRTRSKSLSNLEKAVDEGINSEDDLVTTGGSAGVGIPIGHRSPGRPRASSSGGEGHGLENGIIGSRRGARIRGMMYDHWEQAFSDPGEPLYIERSPRRTSWLGPHASSREMNYKNEWFTDQPEDLRGFPIHAHLIKGSRGFGFNIVGGSRPREFLQVYSVTASGPSTLKTADILVYINDTCVLGMSHKEAVEMLKAVPVGHSIDIEVRRGYPMLYNPDGRPKHSSPRSLDSEDHNVAPTTTQPQPLHQLPRLSTPSPQSQHFNGFHSDRGYVEHGVTLDANGNATSYASRLPPPYRGSNMSNVAPFSPVRLPRSHRGFARLQSLDPTLASQSDSEVVSAVGSHRASMIRNHNNNSLSTPQHHLRYGNSKSSESDLSTCTMPGTRLPLPESPRRPSSSPGGQRSTHSQIFRPQTSHLRPPPTRESPHHHIVNGFHGNTSPTASPTNVSSPGALSVGSGFGGFIGGEVVPVALAQTAGDQGLGFSLKAGGSGGRLTVVERVWDRKQCNSLQPGDAVVKINGADVQSLTPLQIQTILQEHTKQGEVILLVYRGGIYNSVSPASVRRLPPPLLHPPPPPVDTDNTSLLPEALPVPRTSTSNPSSPRLTSSALIQSTSFLESIPVTLTMEPKDWIDIGLEDEAGGGVSVPEASLEKRKGERTRRFRGIEVELKRKPGEGFGFVIASQDLVNGRANQRAMLERLQSALKTVKESKPASLLPHRFVTVRRGSPAAKSGQIRPGDRLEAVDGRSVVSVPHRELAQILRRAGNTLRLTIVPRPSAYSSNNIEAAEHDHGHRSRKGQRSRPKRDSRYYSVDLDRGPSGFGFSLRGGSEYNMGLYVLGLMEGGPASRSQKIQVSDQLVEINGDSTTGMTHSQAVEMIRRGGHRIHLVLKRGNGYVPDYGHEHRITSPSLLYNPKEQGLAAVNSTGRRGRRSNQKRRSRSVGDVRGNEASRGRRRRRRGSVGGERLRSPISERRESSREDRERRRKGRSQSLPRDVTRKYEDDDNETVRGRKRDKESRRRRHRERESRSLERRRMTEGEESEQGEEEQEAPAVQEMQEEEREEELEGIVDLSESEEDNVFLPIPSPIHRLPRPKESWQVQSEENWDMAAAYRELQRDESQEQIQEEAPETELNEVQENYDTESVNSERPLPGVALSDPGLHREPFSFLNSSWSVNQLGETESESGDSQSEGSLSAASISGLSVATGALPGPWLAPVQFVGEKQRRHGRRTGQRGRRGAVS